MNIYPQFSRYSPHIRETSALYISIRVTFKTQVYSATIQNEWTLYKRIFMPVKPIRNRPGTFKRVQQSMFRRPCVH